MYPSWWGLVGQDPARFGGGLTQDPATLFHTLLVSLVSATLCVRLVQFRSSWLTRTLSKDASHKSSSSSSSHNNSTHTQKLRSLQWKFLSVFWLLKTSFWMSGPYFYVYAAYASKTNGDTALISQISLSGYASIALVGPFMGTLSDRYGRKLGTLVAALLYGLGSLSTLTTPLWMLVMGRALGGVGASLLTAAPEAWLVSEFNRLQLQLQSGKDHPNQSHDSSSFIQQTFGVAYAYDSVCAIGAGQLAGLAASRAGPTGPFQASPLFLAVGGFLATVFWNENKAHQQQRTSATNRTNYVDTTKNREGNSADDHAHNIQQQHSIWDAVAVIRSDTRIIFLGSVQSFFEGAMYIFVMQWPPTMNRCIQQAFGPSAVTPYGTAFSCFMACCMAGSTVFGLLSKHNKSSAALEGQTVVLLGLSCLAMVTATAAVATKSAGNNGLWQLTIAYFVFEACVGMYFPAIGTLRSKYLPDSNRSVIMTLFGVPLNMIVVTVFLLVHKLGDVGALAVAAAALGLATVCMMGLFVAERQKMRKEQVRNRFRKVVRKAKVMHDLSDHFREALAKQRTEHAIRQTVQENRDTFSTFNGLQFF